MCSRRWAIGLASMTLGLLLVPNSASAALTLREGGTTVPVGTKIIATGDENIIFAGGELSIACSNNSVTGTVVKNNGSTMEWTIEAVSLKGAEAEERCNGGAIYGHVRFRFPALTNEGGSGHWCMKSILNEDKFEIIGGNCGTANGSITMVLEGNINCYYTRSAPLAGTFTTTTGAGPSTLAMTGAPVWNKEAPSNVLCPATLGIAQMKFTLSTDNEAKTLLQLDDVS